MSGSSLRSILRGRRVLVGAVLVALPVAAGAQRSPTLATDAFRDIGATFGNRLVAAFDSIPAARYGYRPTAAQQSVGYIAQHLEAANYVLCEALGGVAHPTGPRDALADTVKAQWPKDTLVARLRASLAYCAQAFTRLDDAKLRDSVPLGPAGRARPALRARALGLYVTDLAEHYSQVASYMRLMGLVPPSALPRPSR